MTSAMAICSPYTRRCQLPSLANHQSNDFTKLLLIGEAMSGKTGSLVSLVKAGYRLRIQDYDNKLDVLKYYVQHECPEFIGNIEYVSLRDKRKTTPGGSVIDGKPKAFIEGMKLLDNWKYTNDNGQEVDFGKPSEWGPDTILIIDSLSRLCDAAFDFREPLVPVGKSGERDMRAVYGDTQDAVEMLLATLTSKTFQTNVIVIAHVAYQELPDGTTKGFPQGVGQKLSPKIPQYFPSAVLYTNKGGKRTIQTNSTPLIDLANPAPFKMEKSYPIESGLADFFAVLRDPPAKEKPKAVTLKRV
jgi:AAA domain